MLGLGLKCRVLGLGLIDEFFIVPEIAVAELGVAVEAEGLPDKGVELPDEEVGQVEGGELLPGAGEERLGSLEEGIAMGSCDHLDTETAGRGLKLPAGAAIGVGEEDAVMLRAGFGDRGLDGGHDAFGVVVEDRGQAL